MLLELWPAGELMLALLSGFELGFALALLVAWPLTPAEVLAAVDGLMLDGSPVGGGAVWPLGGGVALELGVTELLTVMLFTTAMPLAFCWAICPALSLSVWLATVPVSVIWLLSELTLTLLLASEGSC
jgi:hypothetical protein